MPVSLKQVARKAGVSLSTASRILSDDSPYSFKPETRQRVLDACHELGYQPNLAARTLASGKSQIVAFAVPRIHDSPFTALGSLQILASLEEAFSERGYHVVISSPRLTDGRVDPMFEALIQSGYLAGIVVDGHFAIGSLMRIIRQHDLPCVVVGYADHAFTLRADNYGGFRQIMDHLCGLGHDRIGIIGLDDRLFAVASERMAGIEAGALEHGLDFQSLPYVDGRFSQAEGMDSIRTLVQTHPELTALVALNDRLALNAMRVVRQIGLRIPQDISVVGYDDLPQAADVVPGLTTVNQNLYSWGTIAAEMLLEIIAGGSPASVVLETQLIVRESTAPPRPKD